MDIVNEGVSAKQFKNAKEFYESPDVYLIPNLPVDTEARQILAVSYLLGTRETEKGEPFHSFSSLLLACVYSNNAASRWFKRRLLELNVTLQKQKDHVHYSDFNDAAQLLTSNEPVIIDTDKELTTGSAREWRDNANVFASRRFQKTSDKKASESDQYQVCARDLIASFIFAREDYHKTDKASMGLAEKNAELANGFLSFIIMNYPMELSTWGGLFRDFFKQKPAPDILEGPSTKLTTDKWTTNDKLGYLSYARAIRHFIVHSNSEPPLSISIQAPWGGGKTSLMRMIQKELDADAVEAAQYGGWKPYFENTYQAKAEKQKNKTQSDHANKETADPYKGATNKQLFDVLFSTNHDGDGLSPVFLDKKPTRYTVWFNAWKYESGKQLWSGLATAIIDQITGRMTPLHRELFLLQLQLQRVDPQKIRDRVTNLVFNKTIEYLRNVWVWISSLIPTALAGTATAMPTEVISATLTPGLLGAGVFGSVIMLSVQIVNKSNKAKKDVDQQKVSVDFKDWLTVPNYSEALGFTHHVVEDLQRIFKVLNKATHQGEYANKLNYEPIVIFIDDLDRCSPTKVAEVVEGVNMFMAGDFMPCVFIIGMDPQMVSASLEKAHEDIIKQMPGYDQHTPVGWRFMDKFIQLPFTIPLPRKMKVGDFTDSLINEPDVEKLEKEIDRQAELEMAANHDLYSVSAAFDRLWDKISEKVSSIKDKKAAETRIANAFGGIWQNTLSESYSDSHPVVREMLTEASRNYSRNPRDIKRLLNVIRFYYFISRARIASDQSIPDNEMVGRWISLTLRWPAFVRWLQFSPNRHSTTTSDPNTINMVTERLKIIEDTTKQHSDFTQWQKAIRAQFNLSDKDVHWDKDQSLHFFFRDSVGKNPLSEGAKLGFY